ncbi:hypothetical protein PS925_00050 [Pseudomonas fluorescens]|uniref:Uncharacterized protein n=1 Tax=Pseudomonas fluorescens TaxID=294 RepID=A0A5E7RPZ4_PSEFL|nr:hypothetical protein PS925_00050 [Pseudomonas fluorescens]
MWEGGPGDKAPSGFIRWLESGDGAQYSATFFSRKTHPASPATKVY